MLVGLGETGESEKLDHSRLQTLAVRGARESLSGREKPSMAALRKREKGTTNAEAAWTEKSISRPKPPITVGKQVGNLP